MTHPLDERAAALYADARAALVDRTFTIPRGPYAGRNASIVSVSIDCDRVSVWVRIARLDSDDWLENDHARRWQAWRLSEVVGLL